MASETPATAPRTGMETKTLLGIVVSDKRKKTITVEVGRRVKHPLYGKYLYRSTKYHAHDEKNEAKTGDRVEIRLTRPLSKQKRWRLTKIVERAVAAGPVEIKEVEVPGLKHAAPAAEAVAPEAPAGQGS